MITHLDYNNELDRTEVHEAGHALMHYLTQGSLDEIEYISIGTGPKTGSGLCEVKDYVDEQPTPSFYKNRRYWFNIFSIQYAGVYAESFFFKQPIDEHILDCELQRLNDAKPILTRLGLHDVVNGVSNFDSVSKQAIEYIKNRFIEPVNLVIIESIAKCILNTEEKDNEKRISSGKALQVIKSVSYKHNPTH